MRLRFGTGLCLQALGAGLNKGTKWQRELPVLKPDKTVRFLPHICSQIRQLSSSALSPWHFSSCCPALELRVSASFSASVSKSTHGPFKRSTRDCSSPSFHPDGIPAGFHNQKPWGLLCAALVLRPGKSGMGLGALSPQWGPLQPRCPSLFLTAIDGCGTCLFCVSVPPVSLHVVSLLYP